jgi:phosphatidylglycerol:prolipoprotein diacylglycerol transferase
MRDPFGQARWPAVPVEMGFNLLCAGTFFLMRKKGVLAGQHFHIYLMAYGVFRFFHEYLRDTPRILGGLTGYQIGAAGCFVLGLVGYVRRRGAIGEDPGQIPVSPRDGTSLERRSEVQPIFGPVVFVS